MSLKENRRRRHALLIFKILQTSNKLFLIMLLHFRFFNITDVLHPTARHFITCNDGKKKIANKKY